MRKLLPLIILALCACNVYAQNEQFVSTEVSNKNVILEEYTGVNCGYCPDGHKIANQIVDAHPGRVFAINIHTGSYAPIYTTSFGTSLMNQTGLTGFPTGTINRHVFSGSTTALDRSSWSAKTNTILGQTSPVNIAARGTLDWTTREVTITVQLYYTSDEANATNKLNIAILQDNVIGKQSNASTNPSQVVGNQYRHMHMLRHLITGQWGDDITTTTAGSFVEKTYTYTIPQNLGSPALLAKIEDLHFVAFVAQGHQEILTGCEVEIENINYPAISARIDQANVLEIVDCSMESYGEFVVTNLGTEPITSINYEYKVASAAAIPMTWEGNIAPSASASITLPHFETTANLPRTVKTTIKGINGQEYTSNEGSMSVKKYNVAMEDTVKIKIKTDSYNTETSFKIFNSSNAILMQKSGSSMASSDVNEYTFIASASDCYRLEVYDSYGDGISGGYIRIYNKSGVQQLSVTGSSFEDKLTIFLPYEETPTDVETAEYNEEISMYPNPVSDILNISSTDMISSVEIVSITGQEIFRTDVNSNEAICNVENVKSGIYFVRIFTNNTNTPIVKKFVKE